MSYIFCSIAIAGPSSDLLVQYLETHSLASNKTIVELGTGCGYVGIASAVLGAKKVTLTDMLVNQSRMEYDAEGMLIENEMKEPSRVLLDNCDHNLSLNEHHFRNCSTETRPLHWGKAFKSDVDSMLSSESQCDLLLGSDLTYNTQIAQHLFWTISYILKHQERKGINCRCILAHEERLELSTLNILATAKDMGLDHEYLCNSDVQKTDRESSAPELVGRKDAEQESRTGKYVLWEFSLCSYIGSC